MYGRREISLHIYDLEVFWRSPFVGVYLDRVQKDLRGISTNYPGLPTLKTESGSRVNSMNASISRDKEESSQFRGRRQNCLRRTSV